MDNFFSTTPVLSCARSMFMATDGLIYEPHNITRCDPRPRHSLPLIILNILALIFALIRKLSRSQPLTYAPYRYSNRTLRGLERMLSLGAWPEWRKERQRQLACWYQRVSMSDRKSAVENIEILEYHLNGKSTRTNVGT